MPGPSNTLLIEGAFSELAEELSQYLDGVAKSEDGTLQAELEPLLGTVREAEQNQEGADSDSVQNAKDEILKKIVTKAAILNSAPEKEFVAAYNLLISLCSHSAIQDQLFSRICKYLSEQPVTSSNQYGPSLAISTLTTVFNVLPLASEARYHVFLAILKVIRATSSAQAFDALTAQLEVNVPNWLSAWQLEEEDARALHLAIADVATVSGNRDLKYKYLLNALETIQPGSAAESESQALAKRVLLEALTNPSVTDFTPLTASEAIQNLRKSDANLFELLEVFSSDDYSSYQDFLSSNSLSSLSIPDSATEVLNTKIRLLTLTTIAASSPTRSVSYSAIASALQVPAEEVEVWVIDTIRAGLVEGKLSQLKQEFLVQRATYRVFGERQWAEIQGRLLVWRRSLETVLQAIRSERERFLREGPQSYDDQQQGQGQGRFNGWGNEGGSGGQRRQGGGRRNQQQQQHNQGPREVDVSAD